MERLPQFDGDRHEDVATTLANLCGEADKDFISSIQRYVNDREREGNVLECLLAMNAAE